MRWLQLLRLYCEFCGKVKDFVFHRRSGGYEYYQDDQGHGQSFKVK